MSDGVTNGEQIRVVLCDDARDYVAMLEAFLMAEPDIDVVGIAYDGYQAIDQVERRAPDVLVLDVSMPKMDGLTALKTLTENNTSTCVVMHSGFSSTDIQQRARELGAAAFVEKGVNTRDLVTQVRACGRTAEARA